MSDAVWQVVGTVLVAAMGVLGTREGVRWSRRREARQDARDAAEAQTASRLASEQSQRDNGALLLQSVKDVIANDTAWREKMARADLRIEELTEALTAARVALAAAQDMTARMTADQEQMRRDHDAQIRAIRAQYSTELSETRAALAEALRVIRTRTAPEGA